MATALLLYLRYNAPHLHVLLMDSSNITSANGLTCAFEEYELFKNGNKI